MGGEYARKHLSHHSRALVWALSAASQPVIVRVPVMLGIAPIVSAEAAVEAMMAEKSRRSEK